MIASQNIQNGDAEIGGGGDAPPPKVSNKKMTIEKIYQKKSQREHILLRPDTYIGSVEPVTEPMWVYNSENKIMEQKTITYVPGLYKIFDEIIVNAADNKQRDPTMNSIKVDIDAENNTISVWNNGKGIPVVEHKDEKMYVPTMIFGHLLTSSNYNDIEEKVTGGRNGFGAKLCNIFSTKFTVETASSDDLKVFKQSWADNMTKATEPKIKVYTGSNDFTKVTFSPDLKKFKMTCLDEDIVALLSRRAFDIAASSGVTVSLNGKAVPVKNFSSYITLYLKDKTDDLGNPLKPVYERVNERWEVALTVSSNGFQQVSFVNSIATTKGGRHVDHVSESIVKHIVEMVKKKNRKGLALKANQIKQNLWLFLNCLIVNPTFDSQTKENMTLQVKNFGSKCVLSEKFFSSVSKSNLLDILLNYAKIEEDKALGKAQGGKKKNKLKISKLDDAVDAGTHKSMDCTLILTEGDSAKTLAVSGLGVVGRTKYGIFPLRGKLLNVREAPLKQIMNNTEISHIMDILGLKYKTVFETEKDLKSLRYGRLMIMTDQDQDGSHIKGLLINFIHHNWPSLLRLPFLEEFITPIVKAIKGKKELSFYSIPEYEEWKSATENWHTYKIKYYKGLGTSTSKEAKEYFADMKRHRIIFKYGGPNDDNNITMAFSKKCVDQRKEWLTHWMESMKQRRELGLPEQYLYEKDTKAINYSDFVNKELVLFSNSDNERSIPCMIDGLKPGQRKVLFTCLKRKDKREVKVAQLAGSVAEHSAYHHGEQSLMSTIINLAQNFVGSNNINVLQPIGQFGSRLCGGKDAASPRYIFTKLSPLTQNIYNALDEVLLKYQYDDNQKIEPTWYVPLIPMVLVNGADGIGTGWMTKIPNYNPREIVNNIYKLLDGEEPVPMKPWYKNFRGVVEVDNMAAPCRYVTFGEIALLGDETLEISELPVGVWTNQYKEFLENLMRTDSKTPGAILDYEDHSSDTSVRFVITMKPDKLKMAEEEGLHKFFKLQATCTLLNMCAFDADGCLKKYDSALDILKEFYAIRLEYYEKRKSYLEGVMQAESLKLSNQARFILEKCSGELTVENKKRKAMIDELEKKGYDADPVRVWKLKQNKDETLTEEADSEETPEDEDKQEKEAKVKYDYLLGMAMWSLTLERKNAILKQRDEKLQEYETLRAKTAAMLWREDLASFMKKLDEVESQEQLEAESEKGKPAPKKGTTQKSKRPVVDTRPADFGERIVPKLDADLLKKFDKTNATKEKKVKVPKKKTDKEKDEFDTLDKPGKSLKERLGNSPEMIEKKMNAKRKERKTTKSGKTKKKRSGTFSESGSDFNDTGSEEEFSPKTAPSKEQPRREVSRRQAAAKVKFSYSDEDEQFSDGDEEFVDNCANVDEDHNPEVMADETVNVSDTDSDFDASPQKKQNKPAESSDAMFDSLVQSPEKNSPSPQKKAQPKKRQLGKVNSTKVKKPSAPAKRSKKTAMSSDSDEDMFVPKAKKGKKKESVVSDEEGSKRATTGRAKKAPKYAFSDEDEDDSDIYVESD